MEKTGHVSGDSEELERRLECVQNWVSDSDKEEEIKIDVSEKQKRALKMLADDLREGWTEENLEKRLYLIAKECEISAKEFFKTAYQVILGIEHGPRLAMLIIAIGEERIRKLLSDI